MRFIGRAGRILKSALVGVTIIGLRMAKGVLADERLDARHYSKNHWLQRAAFFFVIRGICQAILTYELNRTVILSENSG